MNDEKIKIFIMYEEAEEAIELLISNAAKKLNIPIQIKCSRENSRKLLKDYDYYFVHPIDSNNLDEIKRLKKEQPKSYFVGLGVSVMGCREYFDDINIMNRKSIRDLLQKEAVTK